MYLIDGRAELEIEQYVKEGHTFDAYSEKVHYFDDLGKKLSSDLPKEVNLVIFIVNISYVCTQGLNILRTTLSFGRRCACHDATKKEMGQEEN